ncbi:hypothetical protein J7E88_04355 [Streptomyces sp. ISL-10]|uniref:hypothetical protein n=1 Tax=Streptomyces sp. ISL-10 TaxID=2819172 RepID=UPI001BE72F39|nr:hypothetical protein [Streptomyces sp. ISL-10]MBT2364575.1 hypothetical protein [Streptomyces sp. ISL-10]
MNLRRFSHPWDLSRARAVVIAVAAIAFVAKMALAASTRGPVDVRYFESFSQAVAQYGTLYIYEQALGDLPVYNHPPLTSWMLLGLREIAAWGIPFSTLIRTPACLADFVTCILVFEILRRRTSLCTAVLCAVGAALCPLLVATSGYHGNTDTIAVMFAFAAAHLLLDRASPALAGCAVVLSFSVKLPPVVAVPLFFLAAWRLGGRAALLRFGAAFTALVLAVWGPVLVTVPGPLRENVLEYGGGHWRMWGLIRFAEWARVPEPVIAFAQGDGHFLFVLVCAATGMWLVWRRPAALHIVLATTLGLLLLLSTASGLQYLAWPAAGLFVIGLREGLSYGVVSGALAAPLYAFTTGGLFYSAMLAVGIAAWLVLAFGVLSGIRAVLGAAAPDTGLPAGGIRRAGTQSAFAAARPGTSTPASKSGEAT